MPELPHFLPVRPATPARGDGVGYDAEAAFNRAFKRVLGEPPGRYRRAEGAAAEGPVVLPRMQTMPRGEARAG